MSLHFIGTNHADPRGPQRLEKALEYDPPEVVTVEIDQQLLQVWDSLALTHQDLLKEICSLNKEHNMGLQLMIDRMAAQLYEVTQSLEFGKRHNLPILGVSFDHDLHYQPLDQQAAYLLSPDHIFLETQKEYLQRLARRRVDLCYFNFLLMERSPNQFRNLNLDPEMIEKDYAAFHSYFTNASTFRGVTEEQASDMLLTPEDIAHDLIAATLIEGLLQPDLKVVHVGGLSHCLRDAKERTLFSQLQKYSPTRETLKWYEDK